ncbi:hypothetical protein BKA93DRAFT_754121 [Sparassis latifolia]
MKECQILVRSREESSEVERSRTKLESSQQVAKGSDASRRLLDGVRPGGLGAYHRSTGYAFICMSTMATSLYMSPFCTLALPARPASRHRLPYYSHFLYLKLPIMWLDTLQLSRTLCSSIWCMASYAFGTAPLQYAYRTMLYPVVPFCSVLHDA